jgi:diguanylate cyclase (GGDEF)-like protein
MPEAGRTQLLMMLMQQAGPGALPLSILPPSSFIPFIRAAEQLCIDEALAPIVVYWSRHSAARLLPGGPRYRQLMRDAYCVSIFSQELTDPPDEWCVLIESRNLSLIAYGLQALEGMESEKYQCTGSLDPQIVRQSFNRLLPTWQFIDLTESNRLEDARVNVGYCDSAATLVQRLRSQWPVVKSPIQQSLILPETGIIAAGEGKINPIAVDGTRDSEFGQLGPTTADDQTVFDNPSGQVPPQSGGSFSSLSDPGFSGGLDFSPSEQSPPATDAPPASEFQTARPQPVKESGSYSVLSRPQVGREVPSSQDPEKQRSEAVAVAQSIISDIIGRLRHSGDLSSILQFAIEKLTRATESERGLIWQIVGDQLGVTNEFAASGHTPFVGNLLPFDESTKILLEFLKQFPDDSGAGVITIPNTSQDTNLHKMSPMLSTLIELGEVKARLMVQLRSRGKLSGFLELQQSSSVRNWSRQDALVLQSVAEMLSFVVQQTFDQSKSELDAREMKLINDIASLFRESRGRTSQESLVKSVMLVAEHMGFVKSQIYLINQEQGLLLPQIQDSGSLPLPISDKDNPFVAAFEYGRGKVINMEYSKRGDSFFGHDVALVLPLVSEGERLGVVGLWQRQIDKNPFRAQDRELGLTIAGHLSNVIRAEQAILQIRADQARGALINKVSNEIRQSLKEVDQILETLVESLRDHFDLALCVVSLYDPVGQNFSKSKTAQNANLKLGQAVTEPGRDGTRDLTATIGEQLFLATLQDLQSGKTIFLSPDEIKARLSGYGAEIDGQFKAATLVPLVHAGNFKAALCMMQANQERPLPNNDMMMVADLADRVAVVVSHAELFAQVERQAVTDPMTGLSNRRYFEEQLAREIDRYQRFGHAFSLVIVDLDYLKRINDTLGHNSGDIAIKHIANVLKRNVRDVDTVGRYGGEEFVVLLPETDVQHARMVSERICSAIREKPIEGVGTITASLGLATYPTDAQDGDKLFKLADEALYRAKQNGRNRVCSVSEDLGTYQSSNGEVMPQPSLPALAASTEQAEHGVELKAVAEKGLLGILSQLTRSIEERELLETDRSSRAASYAQTIATGLHWSKERSEEVTLAATFSNLGKLDVPEDLLRKAGPLSDEETEQLKQCPTTAAKFLKPAKLLHRVGPILEAYKEHWDGSGYPKGLKGDDIPIESRVVALVDGFVTMTTDRPQRRRLSREEAIKRIQEKSGKEYDPRLVKIFLFMLQKERRQNKIVTK